MPVNYSLALENELKTVSASGRTPRLLLHACCAPCASYVTEYLARCFDITIFFYNPNIYPREEYDKRAAELYKLKERAGHEISIVLCEYGPERFISAAEPLRGEPEGGRRCAECFRLRLEETAKHAKNGGFDYFSTTLTVSPHKNAALLNEIGGSLAGEYGISYLFSDFKKKDGYKRSVFLSGQYGLYRQDYCGCMYSRREEG